MNTAEHRSELLRQFTLQAAPFAALPAHSADEALRLFVELGELSPADAVLDAGCGPGLLACFLAPRVGRVTGVDVTPAMVDAARSRARSGGRTNADFAVGDMLKLPFAAAAFDGVVTRFTFHHVPDVAGAFRELVRVTKPGGRIVVMDAAPPAAHRDAYDRVERLRDPSHARALTLEELVALGEAAGLGPVRVQRYGLTIALEALLASSFPLEGGAAQVRAAFEADVGREALGFGVSRAADGALRVTFPIATLAWRAPSD